jgi:hypothetical protein
MLPLKKWSRVNGSMNVRLRMDEPPGDENSTLGINQGDSATPAKPFSVWFAR